MFLILLILLLKFNNCSQLYETANYAIEKNEEEMSEFEYLTKGPTLQISETDLDEYLKFIDQIKCRRREEFTNADSYVSAVNFDKYVEELYKNIVNYIHNNLYHVQSKKYIKKLNGIKNSLRMISENLKEEGEVFTPEVNNDLIGVLNYLKSTYSNDLKLDSETYLNFIVNLDNKFNQTKRRNRVKYRTLQMNIDSKPNILIKEFLEIYKYTKRFPELLIFGFLLEHYHLKRVIIPFHLITLFLTQNEEISIENEIFFVFLLKKTFSCSPKHHIDLINSKKIQLSNSLEISGLYFFTWEFNYKQRKRITKCINQNDKDNFYLSEEDKIHFNIVLRLYLFQHLTYLKYKNVKNKEFEKFNKLVDKVFSKNDCFRTNFYEFLNLI